MRTEAVYAVFVTFQFETPHQPTQAVVAAHQALLSRSPRLNSGFSLKSRSEYAYLLHFQSRQDIDAYLDSAEFCCFRSSPGCYDVFVKVFDFLASIGAPSFDVPRQIESEAPQPQSIVPV